MTILNDTRLQDFMGRVAQYGKEEGKGGNAKPNYALDCIEMAHDGVIGPDHAENVWKAYAEACTKTKGHEKARVSNNKTDKVRISESRKLIAMGCIAWPSSVEETPVDVMKRAIAVINAYADSKGSTYHNMVVVARAQLEARNVPLTDDEIKDAITPDDPEVKNEQELLAALVKRMKKIQEGDPKDLNAKVYPSPELAAAIVSLESRLATLATVDKANKMFELAAELGVTIVNPNPAQVEVHTGA